MPRDQLIQKGWGIVSAKDKTGLRTKRDCFTGKVDMAGLYRTKAEANEAKRGIRGARAVRAKLIMRLEVEEPAESALAAALGITVEEEGL